MKKKILWITSIVLVLIISVSTVAVCMEIKQKNETVLDLYYADDTAEAQKLYTAPDGTQTILSYEKSLESADGTPVHFYKDQEGNGYSFDQSGELIGYNQNKKENNLMQAAETNNDIIETPMAENNTATGQEGLAEKTTDIGSSEKESSSRNQTTDYNPKIVTPDNMTSEYEKIIETARQYVIQTYGEDYFAKFSFTNMIVQPVTKSRYVYFHIRYNERFVTEACSVTFIDGKPDSIFTYGKGGDVGFDPKLLQNIKIETLENFVKTNVTNDYGNKYESYEIEQDIAISKNKTGDFELIIAVNLKENTLYGVTKRVEYTYSLS